MARLRETLNPSRGVVGIGHPLARFLGATIPGLRPFPAISGPGCAFPSTQGALWLFVGGDDATGVHDAARPLLAVLAAGFTLREETATFTYRGGRDLSGYEDGTENPKGDAEVEAAIVAGAGHGFDGGSFVAAQRWVHDLDVLAVLSGAARDALVGRRLEDNEEMADAPPSAHVKRSAQESFAPPAFVVRRSMPWGGVADHGLYFVAYGRSLDAFERILTRMAGVDDGVVDGLLTFSRAVSGGYYFCPPLRDAKVDLAAIGVGR